MPNMLGRLAEIARQIEVNVVEKKLRYRFRYYRDAFVGSKAVDFMVKNGIIVSREDAVALGNSLLREGFIRHVTGDHSFKDENLFYRVIRITPYSFPAMRETKGARSRTKSQPPTASESLSQEASVLNPRPDQWFIGKSQRIEVLEALIQQCNEKANYLDMEMIQLRDAVYETTTTLKEVKIRCEEIQQSYRILLEFNQQQARVIVTLALSLALSMGLAHQSLCLFAVALLSMAVLSRDAFCLYFDLGPVLAIAKRRQEEDEKTRNRPPSATIVPPSSPSVELLARKAGPTEVGDLKRETTGRKAKFGGQFFEHLRLFDKFGDEGEEMEFNSATGIPFETPTFKGRAIFKLRPTELSEMSIAYQQYFRPRARKFSLQIQGRFKKPTSGIIWLGAEVGHCDSSRGVDAMQLGFIRKTLCKMVLNTINLMRGAILHYSFGDGDQLPHIVLPLYIAADTFVETDEKDLPPNIGVRMFPEDIKSQKVRRKSNTKARKFELDKTYSFSLHNSNLDLFNWIVVGIPGIRSMDLTKYWQDMPLRIVAYSTTGPFTNPHTAVNKTYLFCFELSNSLATSEDD
ncbi:hypothetical protein AAMO2058_000614300 [Amorphochlora amoebiformis]